MAGKSGKSSARAIAAARNQARVLELRLQGKTYRDIEAETGLSAGHACRLVGRALAEFAVDSAEKAEAVKRLHLARLDRLMAAVMPRAADGDLKAVDRVLQIEAQRGRLLGLFAPMKVAPVTPDGASEYQRGGLAALLRPGE